ncbi:hypothetical protein V8F20_002172 [Naviculisporaceae sp. PSN 640]
MATTTHAFPLATETAFAGADVGPGTPGSASGPAEDGTAAGASGSSSNGIVISRGGLIAIIIVVVLVALVGILSAVLFYIAKKREWTMRETIRKSARKVVTALTPRRTEFPKSVKDFNPSGTGSRSGSKSRGNKSSLDEVPPTPRIKPEHFVLDLEKGSPERGQRSLTDKKKRGNFSRK